MRHRGHLSAKERAFRAKLAKIVHEKRLLAGSLVPMKRVCGKEGCRCLEGKLHPSLCISVRVGRRRKMFHVPKEWEDTISAWVGNYQEVKRLIGKVSDCCLAKFIKEKDNKK